MDHRCEFLPHGAEYWSIDCEQLKSRNRLQAPSVSNTMHFAGVRMALQAFIDRVLIK